MGQYESSQSNSNIKYNRLYDDDKSPQSWKTEKQNNCAFNTSQQVQSILSKPTPSARIVETVSSGSNKKNNSNQIKNLITFE